MEAWQNRVIEEKTALDEKIVKLKTFIDRFEFFDEVEVDDRALLYNQFANMNGYALALEKRIARFK